jgi:hypothetical protein
MNTFVFKKAKLSFEPWAACGVYTDSGQNKIPAMLVGAN